MPESAGQPLTDETIDTLRTALQTKGYSLQKFKGDIWLFRQNRRIKKVGDRPHLADMDVPHVLLLMGFSMIGSIVQLPAVGGGSQLAVISALQVVYGIPPENIANANFIETGVLKQGAQFITRPAPPVGPNLGGGVEVVTGPNGIDLTGFVSW